MKHSGIFSSAILLLFSCSSPENSQEKMNVPADTLPHTVTEVPIIPDSLPHPSPELKQFMKKAALMGFFPDDTAHAFRASDHRNYFGLADPDAFAAYENKVMKLAKNACTTLRLRNKKKGNAEVSVEEWIFSSEKESKEIEDALTRPLTDKTKERFVRTPLTFWRSHERIYYVHSPEESMRAHMDEVNNELVQCLSPEDQYE